MCIVDDNLDEFDQIEIALSNTSNTSNTRTLMYDVSDKETLVGIIQYLLAK